MTYGIINTWIHVTDFNYTNTYLLFMFYHWQESITYLEYHYECLKTLNLRNNNGSNDNKLG